jgi:dipeptidase E
MKFYLSSFKFGKEKDQLKDLAPKGRIAIIPNTLDYREADDNRTARSLENKIERLEQLGLQAEVVNLKQYFGREEDLWQLIEDIGAVFVLGGNVFVLRQAMRLSGLDKILTTLRYNPDFLYAGYSGSRTDAETLRGCWRRN